MAQAKAKLLIRHSRPAAKNYIRTTKGGTRYVRAIDVLRSEGGRKAIGALLEDVSDPGAPSSNGKSASAVGGATAARDSNSYGSASAAEDEGSSENTTEVPVMRAASGY
jgi:hypothetical protein